MIKYHPQDEGKSRYNDVCFQWDFCIAGVCVIAALRQAHGKLREAIWASNQLDDVDCFGCLRLPRNDNYGAYAKLSLARGKGRSHRQMPQAFHPFQVLHP
jgi:hypothetical protein